MTKLIKLGYFLSVSSAESNKVPECINNQRVDGPFPGYLLLRGLYGIFTACSCIEGFELGAVGAIIPFKPVNGKVHTDYVLESIKASMTNVCPSNSTSMFDPLIVDAALVYFEGPAKKLLYYNEVATMLMSFFPWVEVGYRSS